MYGRIRYWIEACLEIHWSRTRYIHKPFTVINNLDLNTISPSLSLPYSLTDRKMIGLIPCQSKPIDIKLDIPKSKFIKYFNENSNPNKLTF